MKQFIVLIFLFSLFNQIEAMDTGNIRALYKQSSESPIQELTFGLQDTAKENDVAQMHYIFKIIEQKGYLNDESALKELKLYAALFHAVNHGNYEASKYLLEKNVINLQSNPNNLLHMLCFCRWHEDEQKTIEIIDGMLKLGANINRKDTQNRTPLDIASGRFNGYSTIQVDKAPQLIQEYLIKRGAKKTESEAKPHVQERSPVTQESGPRSNWGHPLYEPIRGDFFQPEQRSSGLPLDRLMDTMNQLDL